MTRRILSMLMAFCMIFGMVPASAFALSPTVPSGIDRVEIPVQVNPLYADIVDAAELRIPEADYSTMAEGDYLPEAEAAAAVRENLKNRVQTFRVKLKSDKPTDNKNEIAAMVKSLFDASLAHTGDPVEGDYLRWQYGKWDASVSRKTTGGVMEMDITYTVEYYTTAQQEQELDQAVEQLMDQLGLDQVCDYEKIMGIHDFIIHHVVYDQEHVSNDAYKPQFTAYAALMDGTAVCQGYAVLFYRLALEYGIDARLIPGDSDGNGSADHAWNIVKLDDLYYNLDATFDANEGKPYWFLRGSANFPDHDPDLTLLGEDFYEQYPISDVDRGVKVSEWIETEAPTCTESGTERKTCGDCGKTFSRAVPATGHTSKTDAAKAPTCTETGLTEGSHCSACNQVLIAQEEIAALGHTEVVDEAVAATCTENGLTEGSSCSVCGAVLVAQEIIPATGHTHNGVVTKPTCTEEGYTTFTCACGDTYIDNKVPALGHTEVIDKAVAPTCTESGLTEGKHCSVCAVILVAQETVPATGHSWDEGAVTKEATETETGILTYTCTVCKTTREEVIPTLEHQHVHQGVVTEPTCTEAGFTTYTCACGDTYIDNEVPALGHTEVIDKAVDPTCTEDGLTEGKHCSVCNEILVAQKIILATGHRYENGVCSVCGEKDPEATEPTDPSEPEETDPTDPSEPEETEPTDPSEPEETDPTVPSEPEETEPTDPSEPEETDPTVPSEPEETDPTVPSEPEETDPTVPSEPEETDPADPSEPEETDPTAPSEPEEHTHTFGEWVTVKEPTSTTEGMEERVCTCGKSELRVIPKLTNPFKDVSEKSYYYESVLWAAHKGITSGVSDTQFAPNQACTRAQVVTFLWRAAGSPEPAKGENPFADVPATAYYYKAVLWAVEEGITSGMSKTRFAPNEPCTRAQVVTFLWRAKEEPKAENTKNTFSDVTTAAYYYQAVLWAVENEITAGVGNGKFAPNNHCTRGQIVTFLHRAFAQK